MSETLHETFAKARDTIDQLRAENAALRAMLAKVQFASAGCDCQPDNECYECGGLQAYGHAPDCALAALLEPKS